MRPAWVVSDRGTVSLGDRVIRLTMTLAVVLVAAVAAWISYGHAYELALRWGENEVTARLLPLTLDGLVLAASLTELFCSRYQLQQPALARLALLLGIGATLAVNVLHGLEHGPLAAVLAAWPAVALVVSSELLLWVVATSRSLDKRAVLVVPKRDKATEALSAAAELVANDRSISAAEVGRRLGVRYDVARDLTKKARSLLPTPR